MKLPLPSELKSREHRILFEHDRGEYHAENQEAFTPRAYRDRFQRILSWVLELSRAARQGPEKVKILDVGCAQGNLALCLAERGYRVFAVDRQFDFLTYSKMKYENGKLEYVNASSEELPFCPGSFDIVVAGELIEHVAHPDRLLANLRQMCSATGFLIVTTPNGSQWFSGLPTLSKIKNRAELEGRQFVPDADGHLFLMTKTELCDEGRRAGLGMIRHCYFCTPWLSGWKGFRFWARFLPAPAAIWMDRIFLALPVIGKALAAQQMAVFQIKENQKMGGRIL